MKLAFPGIEVTRTREALIVRSERPLTAVSSAMVGGGMTQVRFIVNRHVRRDYACDEPEADLTAFARRLSIVEPFVGLMTAVTMDKAVSVSMALDELTVAVIATVGLSNPCAAGCTRPLPVKPGTVNLIILVDADLTPAAMVNTVITATEAKTGLFWEQRVRTADGHAASGTSTDAVVAACTGTGPRCAYGGPATPLGWLVGRCVRAALEKGFAKDRQGKDRGRGLTKTSFP